MPTYQYACTEPECGHAFEQVQSFTDDALTVCPQCQGRLRKVFNAVGVVFKGSGFYRTDSRKDGGTDGSTDGRAAATSGGSGSGESGSASTAGGSDKPAASGTSSSSGTPSSGGTSGTSSATAGAGAA